jgi:PAS domain S-box-containing protein
LNKHFSWAFLNNFKGTMAKRKNQTPKEESHQRQEYFEALFEQSPAAMEGVDMYGNVVRWNPAAEDLFGYSQAEAIGRHLDDLVANNDSIRADAKKLTTELTSLHAKRWQCLTKRTRKDGSMFDVEFTGVPIFIGNQPIGGIAIYNDISQQKALEEELRQRKEYFEALFVNNPLAIVTIDQEAKVISWNPAAEELFEYSQAEAIGQNVDDLVAADESIRAEAVGYTDLFLKDPINFIKIMGVLESQPSAREKMGLCLMSKRPDSPWSWGKNKPVSSLFITISAIA